MLPTVSDAMIDVDVFLLLSFTVGPTDGRLYGIHPAFSHPVDHQDARTPRAGMSTMARLAVYSFNSLAMMMLASVLAFTRLHCTA